MSFIESLLGIYVSSIYKEGKRLVEIKSLTLVLKAIKGVRRLVLVNYISVVASMLTIAGLFVVMVHGLNQFEQFNTLYFDSAHLVGVTFIAIGSGSVLWALSEKRWIKAFGLQKYLNQALEEGKGRPKFSEQEQKISTSSNDVNVDPKQLETLIDKLVDKKLNDILIKKLKKIDAENNLPKNKFASKGGVQKAGTA